MYFFDYLFCFAASGLIMSSALPVQDNTLPHSSSTQVGMIIFPKLHTTLTKRKIASSKGSKALIAPQNIPDRQLKASSKKKGKKSKKADCKTKNSKSPKSAKNIFKKSKVGKLKVSCFRVSSKAPNRLGPGPQPKRPGALVQDSTVNTARTSSIGTTVQVAFNGSLTFFRFPHPRSQDQTSTVISVLTLALNSILPDGSSVELTGLSNKTLDTEQMQPWLNEIHTWLHSLRRGDIVILRTPFYQEDGNATTQRKLIHIPTASTVGQCTLLAAKPQQGDIVTVTYHLNTNENLLFDYNTTVSFVLLEGNYIPELHQVVSTLSPGEKVDNIPMDAGYGERNPDLILKVTKKDATETYNLDTTKINVGTALRLSNGATCYVVETTEEDFTIDANPTLAGVKYTAHVKLQQVVQGPTPDQFIYSSSTSSSANKYQVMTIALGCFWGGELMYMRIPGVVGTSVGYTQGKIQYPSYKQVCTGTTGHTEAIQVIYDPSMVSYETLIQSGMDRLGPSMFLRNQVGNDRGTQYRHGVYYHNDEQKDIAFKMIQKFGDACVTECKAATTFFKAEDYHQQYLLKGGQSAKKKEEETIRCYG